MAEIYQDYGGQPQAFQDIDRLSQVGARNVATQRTQALLPGELLNQQAELANKQSLTRWHHAQALDKENDIAEDRRVGQMMANMASEGLSTSESLFKVGKELLPYAPKKGVQMVELGIRQSGHEQSAERNKIDRLRAEISRDIEGYKWVGARAPWIQNQEQLDRFNDDFRKKYNEEPPWGDKPWSPVLMQSIQHTARTQEQKDTLEYREQLRQDREKERFRAERMKELQAEISRNYKPAPGTVKSKDGEKAFAEPKPTQIQTVLGMVKRDNPGVANEPEAKNFAASVSREADRRRRGTAMTFDEAVQQVYQEKLGELLVLKDLKDQDKKVFKYLSPGSLGSKQRPMPMGFTEDRQLAIPPQLRQDKHWYIVDGVPAQWHEGKGWRR